MKMIIIEAPRTGYDPNQISATLTVAELLEILSGYEPTAKIYTSHDGGYTYGGLSLEGITEREVGIGNE